MRGGLFIFAFFLSIYLAIGLNTCGSHVVVVYNGKCRPADHVTNDILKTIVLLNS